MESARAEPFFLAAIFAVAAIAMSGVFIAICFPGLAGVFLEDGYVLASPNLRGSWPFISTRS